MSFEPRISPILKNPFTYVAIAVAATVVENVGLRYENHAAQLFACSSAYYTSSEPLKTPACVKIVERSRLNAPAPR